jgi:hypothetical protein
MAKKFVGLNAKVEMHPLYKVPRRIYDIETRSPRARAQRRGKRQAAMKPHA